MAKMKIFELKNEINEIIPNKIESKDILDYLERSFGVKKTHSSNLEDNEVQVVKNHFVQASKSCSGCCPSKVQKPAAQTASKSPEKQEVHQKTVSTGSKTVAGQTENTGANPKPADSVAGANQNIHAGQKSTTGQSTVRQPMQTLIKDLP